MFTRRLFYFPIFLLRVLAVLYALLYLLNYEPAHCQTPARFTVVTEGAPNGPAILLLPGLSSSRSVFDAEAALLAPTHRLYRVQINGFGGQPAGANASGPILVPVVEELHQYIVANHLHPALIGHSLGGLLGLMLVNAHPADVQKLLIVDSLPFYGMLFGPTATVDSIHPQAQAMHDQMLAQPAPQFEASQPMMASRLVTDPTGQKKVAADSVASDRAVSANAMLEDLSTDVRATHASIKTPTTVLYPYQAAAEGPEGPITALYTRAYAALPNVKMVKIEDSRHFIMYDQPAAFNAAVQTFLK